MPLQTDGASGRGDLGTLGDFGSSVMADFTLSVWLKLGASSTDSVAAMFPAFNHDSVTDNGQSLWWGLNMGYSTGIENAVNSVLFNLGDVTDTGFLMFNNVSTPNWNDQGWHLHTITVKPMPVVSREVRYYLDGVLKVGPTWASQPFNDALASVVNHIRSSTIAARTLTSAVSWFDHTEGLWADARIYKRRLSAYEIQRLFLLRGRDSICDYHRRWDMIQGGRDLSVAKAPLTASAGATFATTVGGISGTRRRAA